MPLVRLADIHDAEALHLVTQAAFAEYACYPNPSSVLGEQLIDVQAFLERAAQTTPATQGAALLFTADEPVGAVRFSVDAARSTIAFSRLSVCPSHRGARLGEELMRWVEARGRSLGCNEIRADARSQQPDNRPYYLARGYEIIGYSGRYGIPDIRTHLRKRL